MDSSEARLDRIESQRLRDDRRNWIYLLGSLCFLKNRGEGTKSVSELKSVSEHLANLRLSDIFAFPDVYMPMSPQIFSAVSAGKQKCLEMIRSYGKPMACHKSDKGDSVLHLAAAWGHLELVKSIVSECPCLLLELDSRDQLPLHVAARAGHVAVVEALVATITFVSATLSAEDKERVNVYVVKDINGDTPLHLALKDIHMKIAACLVKANKRASFLPNKDGITPLYMTVEAGIVSLVREMLKTTDNDGPDLQLEGRKCLVHVALKARNTDILDIILKKYPSLEDERDEEGKTCLSFGASIGFYEGVRMLLRRSTESVYVCNEDGSFPIHSAVEKGHTNVVLEILGRCPESVYLLNKQDQNILHIASKSGNVSFILFNCLWGISSMNRLMEKQDVDGNTPSHLATIKWHPRTLFHLLTNHRGNCMHIRNNNGLTPLDIAESNRHLNYIFKERMTLMVLDIKKPSKRDYPEMMFKKNMTTRSDAPTGDNNNNEYVKGYVNTLLVVAALVATVTFAAGFTIPGGFNSSGPNLGSATLANDVKLICFMVFDTLAMICSIKAIVILIVGQMSGDPAGIHKSLSDALIQLYNGLLFMSVGFYCGLYVAFAHVKGIVIYLNVIFVIFVYNILIILGPHVFLQAPGLSVIEAIYARHIVMILGTTTRALKLPDWKALLKPLVLKRAST